MRTLLERISGKFWGDPFDSLREAFIEASSSPFLPSSNTVEVVSDNRIVPMNSTVLDLSKMPMIRAIIISLRPAENNIASEYTKKLITMKTNEQKFKNIIDSHTSGIFETDKDGFLTYVNFRAMDIFGIKDKEHSLGQYIYSFFSKEYANESRERIEKISSGIDVGAKEYKLNNGKWVRIHPQIKYDIGNDFVIKASISDISELMDVQEKLKESKDELSKAYDMLKKASIARETVIGLISHELLTPQIAIKSNSELLLKMEEDESKLELLREILINTERLTKLFKRLIFLADIRSRKREANIDAFMMPNEIEDIILPFNEKYKEKGLLFTQKIDPKIPHFLYCDQVTLNDVISELLENALTYTEKGTIGFEIKLVSASEDRVKLNFSISDTGQGIPEDKLDEIMHGFIQANNYLTREHEGIAIGLLISNELLKMYDSRISVKSVLGKGSTFSFDLELDVCKEIMPD